MKIVIVGGVAGGATTAARLRRLDEKAEIIIIEKGEHVSFANCGLPYYIGDVIKKRSELLLQTPRSFKNRYNIEVRTFNEVIKINLNAKSIDVKNLKSISFYQETYDKLILSPGATPIVPKITGIESKKIFTLRNIKDMDSIKSQVNSLKIKKVTVVGGGFIGLEMVENFKNLGLEVVLIEEANQVMKNFDYEMATLLHRVFKKEKIGLFLNDGVRAFKENENNHIITKLKSGKEIESDIVLLAIGVRPDKTLAIKAGLELNENGAIIIDDYFQTSKKDIYAIGDAIAFSNPFLKNIVSTYLAGPANKQARLLADNIVFGNKKKYKGAFCTSIVKLFDSIAAMTGLSEKQARLAELPYEIVVVNNRSHASYYPGAKNIIIKIVFNKNNGLIYGAQIIGEEGVDKRIDIIATLLLKEGTIYDLQEIEHAYAPQFSSAKDPINMAGFVAENILNGLVQNIDCEQMFYHDKNSVIIDVRTRREFAYNAIPHAINIPLNELRVNLSKIHLKKKKYLYCRAGLRGYVACRILMQKGFENTYNLQGGYELYKHFIANQNNKI